MTDSAPPGFRPQSLEELRLETVLAAFPGDKIEGRRDPDSDPYISPSQLKMAARCLEQYRRRYVKGEKQRPAAAMLWGSSDHAAHEANFSQKIVSKRDMKTAEVTAMFAAELDWRVGEDGGAAEVEWDKKTPNLTGGDAKKAHADVKDRGVKLVKHVHETVSPAIDPSAVEEQFTIEVEGVPVPIKGAIDLQGIVPLVAGSEERVERIIDRKTSGRTAVSHEWLIQGRVYQLVKPLPIEFQLALKTKLPGAVAFDERFTFKPMPEPATIAMVQRTVAMIATCYEIFGPDDPWPGAFGGFGDTCGYCGFRPWCPWWVDEWWSFHLRDAA